MPDNYEAMPLIDLEAGLGRVRGNKMIYGKMLGLFLQNGEFAALEDALAKNDLEAAAAAAHGIKGMTGNLGMTRLFETSTALMNALRAGNAPDDLLAAYRAALEGTRAEAEAAMKELA